MARKNRHDTDHTRLRARKSRSEYASIGVLADRRAADERDGNNQTEDTRQPAAA